MVAVASELLADSKYLDAPEPTASIRYHVTGAATLIEARDAAILIAPDDVDGVPRQSAFMEPDGGLNYFVTVDYNRRRSSPTGIGEQDIAFSTTGNVARENVALEHIGDFGVDAPDFDGAINVNDKGEAQGVDVVRPAFEVQYRQIYASNYIDDAKLVELFYLTGTVNEVAWKMFAAGEGLYLGAEGRRQGIGGNWELTHRFRGSANSPPRTLSGIALPAVQGHDYTWFRFGPRYDFSNDTLSVVATDAHVERVYLRSPFANIGIT